MTEVHSLKSEKALFDAAPAPQRALYLMTSQLWNDVIILTRQMLSCQVPEGTYVIDAERKARLAAQILDLRLLASCLHEGQSFYKRLKRVLPGWKHELSEGAVTAIASLHSYFSGNDAPLTRLCKKIRFHADYDVFEESLGHLEGPHLEELVGDTAANTLFLSGEAANLAALPWIARTNTRREGLSLLLADAARATEWTYDACHGYHEWFLNEYVFPRSRPGVELSAVDLHDVPVFEAVHFRFFADFEPASMV